MITYIKINGFKSFHNFEMEFTPFTVIAGVNGSGKSNLFDALTLLGSLAEKDLKTAFSEQRGLPEELFMKLDDNEYVSEMEFEVDMLLNRKISDMWGAIEDINHTRLKYKLCIERKLNSLNIDDLYIKYESLEKIKSEDDEWAKNNLTKESKELVKSLRAGGSKDAYLGTEIKGANTIIKIRQDGKNIGRAIIANLIQQTILSSVNSLDFPHVFAVKEEMRNWRLLQFNPEDLREPSRKDVGLRDEMTKSGKNIAAALYRISQTSDFALAEISRDLSRILPNYNNISVIDDIANNQFIIKLKDSQGKEYTSRVLSEGTLRILALCVLAADDKHNGLLCFEEPENGIHPFRINDMLELLIDLSTNFSDSEWPLRQVIVNTHSPVLIRQLDKWKDDKTVSVWYSNMTNRATDVEGKRVLLNVTRILPVKKVNSFQTSLEYSDADIKVTLNHVSKYLETTSNHS